MFLNKIKAEEDKINIMKFNPYIEVKFEKFKPGSYTTAIGLTAYQKVGFNKSILELPVNEQVDKVIEKFIEKYSNHYLNEFYFEKLGAIVEARYYFDYYYYIEIDHKRNFSL